VLLLSPAGQHFCPQDLDPGIPTPPLPATGVGTGEKLAQVDRGDVPNHPEAKQEMRVPMQRRVVGQDSGTAAIAAGAQQLTCSKVSVRIQI
jgi:hypothetical protein